MPVLKQNELLDNEEKLHLEDPMACVFLIPLPQIGPSASLHPFSSHFNCFGSAKSIMFDLINVLSVIGRLFAELQFS